MTNGYSTDLRRKAMAYYDSGKSQLEVCRVFKIGRTAFSNWLRLRRETGDYSLKPRPKHRVQRKIQKETLLSYIKENPDAFLREIAAQFGVATSSVHDACKKYGITRKKNGPLQRALRGKKTAVPAGNTEEKS